MARSRPGGRQRRPIRQPRLAALALTAATTAALWLLATATRASALWGPLTVPLIERTTGAVAAFVLALLALSVLVRAFRKRPPAAEPQKARHEAERTRQRHPPAIRGDATGRTAAQTIVLSGLRDAVEHDAPAIGVIVGASAEEVAVPLLTLALLGPLQVKDQNVHSPQLRATSRELLVYLALQSHGANRDTILAALWPNSDPPQSRQRLWQNTSEIRRALGPVIHRQHEHYQLDRGHSKTDLDQLEQLQTRARDASPGHARTELLSNAYQLFRGEPLVDCNYAWADGHRRRLRAVFADVTTSLAQAHLDADNPTSALTLAERGLELDELDEQLWRLALKAEAQLGLRTAIDQRYRILQHLLSQRLGLQPERETRDLHRLLLSQT